MRDEAERDGFVVTEGKQGRAHLLFFRRVGTVGYGAVESRQGVWKFVVAVQARDLLDEIDLAFNIKPPGRNADRELRLKTWFRDQLESEPFQDGYYFMGFELSS